MTFKHLTETCVAETIGENGLSDEVLARVLMAAAPAQDRLCQLVELRCLPALSAAQSARGTGPMYNKAEVRLNLCLRGQVKPVDPKSATIPGHVLGGGDMA